MNIERLQQHPRLRPRALAELTTAYMQELLKCLTAEELELALLRNSLQNSVNPTCAVHDYCDGNQLLISAWDIVFEVPEDERGCGESLDLQNDDHVSLLNDARDGAHKALSAVLV